VLIEQDYARTQAVENVSGTAAKLVAVTGAGAGRAFAGRPV